MDYSVSEPGDNKILGVVISGDQRGRFLGYPTANIDTVVPHDIEDGVYAGYLFDGQEKYRAAVSIGVNPTFNGTVRKIEAFVLDQNELNLYNHYVEIRLRQKIRDQIKFESVQDLIEKIREDINIIRNLLD